FFLFRSKKAQLTSRPNLGRRSPFRPAKFCPVVEALEDRTVPSTVTVMNTNDAGAGSLRDALLNSGTGDTVQFAPALAGQTIKLTSAELTLNHNLTIDGQANNITVSGEGNFRVLDISGPAKDVTIQNITIANGKPAAATALHPG